MTQSNSQVPWTDEQWARVNQVIQEEANRARVAATFLPLYGPLPPDADFVRREAIGYEAPDKSARLTIDDTDIIKLPTLQVKVFLRGAQMADPNLTSALQIFRRAANLLARLEDALVFRGQTEPSKTPEGAPLPKICEVLGGDTSKGLIECAKEDPVAKDDAESLVRAISKSIGDLEAKGHFGPFAVALGQDLFLTAQTPNDKSLVLPQDRIIPFLGGGALVRSSTLPVGQGVVVALGGAPVELVVATDVSLNFLQVTPDPSFVFRVYEKIALRIKEPDAIVRLKAA